MTRGAFHENTLFEDSSADPLAARRAALDLIEDVLARGKTLDSALERSENFKTLPSRDKAFCRMMVSTTFRRLGQIDDLIRLAEDRPGGKPMRLETILRLGTVQIVFMHVPDHAAVDTSVRLAIEAGLERQKGFVNAILRAMARGGRDWLTKQDEGRLNAPEWMLREWIADYGLKTAAHIAAANLSEAPLDITVKDPASLSFWAAELKANIVAGGTLRLLNAGNVTELPGYNDGAWWVQDAAAALPARLMGDVRGQMVYDLCAAPGGKTAQLAAMGAQVTALDKSPQRLAKMRSNLARLGLAANVTTSAQDAAAWDPATPASHILCDAPCTATGTVRRHPDVLRLKKPGDMAQLTTIQQAILSNAFERLAPGGVLVYAVCSLQKAEGERQIEQLLHRQRDAMKIAITAQEVGGLEDIVTESGDVRILPHHSAAIGGMDGFFISRLTKRD